MRSIFLIVCLSLITVQVFALSAHKKRAFLEAVMKECKLEENGSDADYESIMAEKLSETGPGKCMMACGYEVVGLFDQGAFNRGAFLHIARIIVDNDETKLKEAPGIADECGKITGERCQQAYDFSKCLHDYLSMKILKYVALLLMICGVTFVKSDDREEKKKMAKEMMFAMSEDCREQEGATEADLDVLLENKNPTTKSGRCLVACLQEQFGVVDNLKFVPEAFVSVSAMAIKEDEEKMKLVKEVAQECKDVTDVDRCELAMKISDCLRNALKKRNVEF
ncbi:CLUMA_CG010585, isoform A [Clunio marinus]|uniref:CLUMA_CG010585, isoform A n=1 Tax=Clunio marinus TaxID=568069 RepID=A0A1J1ICB1_9DIPT|nr:CLUMA_CG010585, isoform A [Clunio marinus]